MNAMPLKNANFYEVHTEQSKFRRSKKSTTAIGLLAALGLSACGGGGGSSTTTTQSNNTNSQVNNSQNTIDQNDENTSNTDDQQSSTDDITAGGGGAVGGGGGGGGGGVVSTPSSNLTLSNSGGNYSTTELSGFTLLGTDSHYRVADASSNSYNIKLTADGTGMLTFEFSDADDVITLDSGSSVTGFTQLRVIKGTVDVSNASLGGVTYVSVASGVKLTADQVLELETIVINAASGSIDVVVSSQAEIDEISNALSSGSLNLFSASNDLMTLEAASGSGVTATDINSAQSEFNTLKQDVSASGDPTVVIRYATNGLVGAEKNEPVQVNIFDADLVSARIDGVSLGNISGNSFTFDASSMQSGFHRLSITSENASGVQRVSEEEFLVVGTSYNGSDMFEFKTSQVGNVITVDAYVKNLHSNIADGIRSYDFWINFDETKFDYVEGSFAVADGSINFGAENQANGEIFANGIFDGPWSSYSDAFFSFQVNDLSNSSSLEMSFVDFDIYRTDFGDFTISVDV